MIVWVRIAWPKPHMTAKLRASAAYVVAPRRKSRATKTRGEVCVARQAAIASSRKPRLTRAVQPSAAPGWPILVTKNQAQPMWIGTSRRRNLAVKSGRPMPCNRLYGTKARELITAPTARISRAALPSAANFAPTQRVRIGRAKKISTMAANPARIRRYLRERTEAVLIHALSPRPAQVLKAGNRAAARLPGGNS